MSCMRFSRFAILAALLTSACGGKTGDAPSAPAEPGSPPDNLVTTPGVTPPRATTSAPPDEADPPSPPNAETLVPGDVNFFARDAILSILAPMCGTCHGGSIGHVPPDPLQFTDDMDRMVALGIIIPLDSGGSPLIQVIRNGSMPPPGVQPRPATNDVELLAQFIDNPRFWPTPISPVRVDAGNSVPPDTADTADAGSDGG
jgi:hypothetical protein